MCLDKKYQRGKKDQSLIDIVKPLIYLEAGIMIVEVESLIRNC